MVISFLIAAVKLRFRTFVKLLLVSTIKVLDFNFRELLLVTEVAYGMNIWFVAPHFSSLIAPYLTRSFISNTVTKIKLFNQVIAINSKTTTG